MDNKTRLELLGERIDRVTDELRKQAEQFPAILQKIRDIGEAMRLRDIEAKKDAAGS